MASTANAERQVGHVETDHREPKERNVDLQEERGSAQDVDVCHGRCRAAYDYD